MSSKRINLADYQPKEHQFKAIFKQHGIKTIVLANYLGYAPAYVWSMLNGHDRMSKPAEQKLQVLVDQIEADSFAEQMEGTEAV